MTASKDIPYVEAALARTEVEIDAMYDEWARNNMPCCPSCAFGARYTDACAKAERQSAWLVYLLYKRNARGDIARAERIAIDSLEGTAMLNRLRKRDARKAEARARVLPQ